MTDIEQKALALVRDVADGYEDVSIHHVHNAKALRSALCRAIEQHETFRQEVSDAVERLTGLFKADSPEYKVARTILSRFIIAKPDPLVEALDEALWEVSNVKLTDRELRAVSLRLNAKRGGKIVWGEG